MSARETKLQESRYSAPAARVPDDGFEADWGGVFYPAAPTTDEWRPGFWDALVGYSAYIDPDRLGDPESERRLHRSSDDEDFSSEHGYQPGFEGRSEFEHGEFDRWL
jgi:hypothetical protein